MNTSLLSIYFQIKFEISTFKNQLNKLEVHNYPTPTAGNALQYIRNKILKYEDITEKIFSEKDEGGEEETKEKLITKIHNPLIQHDAKFLNWLQASQTANVPWSFISSIEELSKHILPNQKVLVSSENSYNYGICWSQSQSVAPYPFHVISLPELHRINILWHVLVGHEIFHPCCMEFISQHNQQVLTSITKLITKDLKKHSDESQEESLFSEQEEEDRILRLSETTHIAWIRAFEELLSDMACAEVFGPAALFAMIAFSLCSPQNEMPTPDNNFYPSWKYRLETVWKNIIDETSVLLLSESIHSSDMKSCYRNTINDIKNNDNVQYLAHIFIGRRERPSIWSMEVFERTKTM